MSRRGKQAYWARQSEPQRAYDRWSWETLARAPHMPYPLPGEIEEGWCIYRILEEIERLRPSIEAARKAWFERRRAMMPPEVVAWLADAPERASTKGAQGTESQQPQRQRLSHLTPSEKRERKLQQTRESNALKRAERRAAGLPYK
jgi:hypothetical protein